MFASHQAYVSRQFRWFSQHVVRCGFRWHRWNVRRCHHRQGSLFHPSYMRTSLVRRLWTNQVRRLWKCVILSLTNLLLVPIYPNIASIDTSTFHAFIFYSGLESISVIRIVGAAAKYVVSEKFFVLFRDFPSKLIEIMLRNIFESMDPSASVRRTIS